MHKKIIGPNLFLTDNLSNSSLVVGVQNKPAIFVSLFLFQNQIKIACYAFSQNSRAVEDYTLHVL